ncbi:MAG: prephenate dehydrogenase [Streptomycetaceae bacterium]|nr:MAG: prephenate dehydrogenase [Streptomycetaceae bacterium]
MSKLPRVKIQGSGLIGTSCALALKQRGYEVAIFDENPAAQVLANDLLNNPASRDDLQYDLVLIAVPVSKTLAVLKAEYSLNPNSILLDVGSTKNELQVEVDAISEIKKQFLGTHPIAGREVSGALGARADLFDGRAWIITPTTQSSPLAISMANEIIEACGATVYSMSPSEHDELLAQISHLPQLVSSMLAGELLPLSEAKLSLAGQGLRDTTRLADSNAAIWLDILDSNRELIISKLESFTSRINQLRDALVTRNSNQIAALFKDGNSGRSRISGKHGARPRSYSYLSVVIPDRPGQLGALFLECATAEVNVEDLALEHSPGQFTGLITLALSESDAMKLEKHLRANNWKVHKT